MAFTASRKAGIVMRKTFAAKEKSKFRRPEAISILGEKSIPEITGNRL